MAEVNIGTLFLSIMIVGLGLLQWASRYIQKTVIKTEELLGKIEERDRQINLLNTQIETLKIENEKLKNLTLLWRSRAFRMKDECAKLAKKRQDTIAL